MAAFSNRIEAGRLLAERLAHYGPRKPIVLGLPRGGVPVAYQVARALHAPLDVCVVRKVGVPWYSELGIGAVAEGGVIYLDHDMMDRLQLTAEGVAEIVQQRQAEVVQRALRFRAGHARPALRDRTVIVVDDGIATGGTVRAALASLRREGPRALVVAVPVVAADVAPTLRHEADELVYLRAPRELEAVGRWYDDFTQVLDEEVVQLLESARCELGSATSDEPA
jgi:putative phosphoribosyl transferase